MTVQGKKQQINWQKKSVDNSNKPSNNAVPNQNSIPGSKLRQLLSVAGNRQVVNKKTKFQK